MVAVWWEEKGLGIEATGPFVHPILVGDYPELLGMEWLGHG